MKVRHIEAFGDSLLVVQQVSGECQCLDRSSNAYLDKCLDVIKFNFDEFCIHHIPRHENCRANDLVQEAFGYNVQSKNFHVEVKPMLKDGKIPLCTEPNSLTATQTSQIATRHGLTTTQAGQTATQAGRSQNRDVVKKIGGSRLLIIYEIQVRRSTKVFSVSLSSLL
jgi:hypothetical protein